MGLVCHTPPPAFITPHAPPHTIHVRAYMPDKPKLKQLQAPKPKHAETLLDYGDVWPCAVFYMGIWVFAASQR